MSHILNCIKDMVTFIALAKIYSPNVSVIQRCRNFYPVIIFTYTVLSNAHNSYYVHTQIDSPLQPVTWRTSVPEGRIFTNPVFDNNQIQVILQESDAGAMFTCSVATVGNFSAQLAFIGNVSI